MKMCHSRWDATLLRGLTVLMLITGAWVLTSCKDDSGLTEGDPNYFTSSRGQFTATLSDGTTLYLLAGDGAGTATLTYDGSNPRHWQSETTATVSVTTYQGDLTLPETVSANGKTYDVYTTTGVLVKKNATSLNGLPAGIYIVNGNKVMVK